MAGDELKDLEERLLRRLDEALLRAPAAPQGLAKWLPTILTAVIAAVGALAAYFSTASEARAASSAAARAEASSTAAVARVEAAQKEAVAELRRRVEEAAKAAQEAKDLARDKSAEAAAAMAMVNNKLTRIETLVEQLLKASEEQRAQVKALQDRHQASAPAGGTPR